MNKKRIFIALPLSHALQQEILNWEASFSNLPVRWISGTNLHMTLIAPWYELNVQHVCEQLEQTARHFAPFSSEFQRVTYGPDPKRPRLIWAEGKTLPQFLSMRDELERVLQKDGGYENPKIHITLARFRPETFSSFSIKKLNEQVQWVESVSSIVLMESHLSRSGADYEIISTHSFTKQ